MAKKNDILAKSFFHKRVVIDASVLVKGFLEEDHSDFVEKLIEMNYARKLTLIAPKLIVFELFNILCRKIPGANSVLKASGKFKFLGITLIDLEFLYANYAIKKVYEDKRLSFYDTSYHALAKQMKGIFLTADQKYYKRMKNEGNIAFLGK